MTVLRPFGHTGLTVSPLGLGTSHIASLSNPHGPATMARLLDQAYDLGLRFFDTADVYGQGDSEALLSRLARKDGVVICTKAGLGTGKATPFVRLAKPMLRPLLARSGGLKSSAAQARQSSERHDLNPATLARRLEGSLRRLKRDCVDIFLLHSPPLASLSDGVLYDVLDSIRARGLARVTGVSVQTLEDAVQVMASGRVDALQVPLSPTRLRDAQPVLAEARQAGIGVIAREVLTGATDPTAALATMLSEPLLPVSLVGTTSTTHLAANAALMEQTNHAS